jgi:rSAM/selenodomain-associated transferase 1
MRRLLVFLKYPSPGKVKTRLAAALGDQAASDVYRVCAEVTLERLRRFQPEAALYVDPPEALERVRRWVGPGWSLAPQQGRTLGERLARATGEAFAEGARPVVVIGTDSPWLGESEIEQAFEALRHADVVIGPAQDGGYYLIGLARPTPALFEGVAWSTPQVCATTLAQARLLGLAVHLLGTGYDVDRLEDLERFAAEAAARGQSSTLLKTIQVYARVSRRGGEDA